MEVDITHFANDVQFGHLHWSVFKVMLRRYWGDNTEYSLNPTFIGWTMDAHLEVAKLFLSKLYDPNTAALSLRKLEPKAFYDRYYADYSEEDFRRLRNVIKPLLASLASTLESDVYESLEQERNKEIAHRQAGTYKKNYLKIEDIDNLYSSAREVVGRLSLLTEFPNSSMKVAGTEKLITESLERLARGSSGPSGIRIHQKRFKLDVDSINRFVKGN